MAAWQARRNNPEALAARRLLAACRVGDASAAYAALIDWKRAVSASDRGASLDRLLPSDVSADLRREWTVLSRHVFGVKGNELPWSGRPLAEVLCKSGVDWIKLFAHVVLVLFCPHSTRPLPAHRGPLPVIPEDERSGLPAIPLWQPVTVRWCAVVLGSDELDRESNGQGMMAGNVNSLRPHPWQCA